MTWLACLLALADHRDLSHESEKRDSLNQKLLVRAFWSAFKNDTKASTLDPKTNGKIDPNGDALSKEI